jgi:hypothetical protein
MPWSISPKLEAWNRKLHFYLGLYFLFFLWLFAFTGLLLNHSQWEFAQFWPERTETSYERSIQPVDSGNDVDQAKAIMRELNLTGEIDWPSQRPVPGQLDFAVNRPGTLNRVSVNLAQSRATVQHIEINSWGVMNALHTFSGTRSNNPAAKRDWLLTSIWVVAMDALAVGVLLMVLSSYYMWYRLKQKRLMGWISLGVGVLSCGLFVVGLAALG